MSEACYTLGQAFPLVVCTLPKVSSARRPSQLPLLPHYGNVGHLGSRHVIEEGQPLSSFTNQPSFSAKRPKSLPPRQENKAVRREHLTPDDVEQLIVGARQAGGVSGHRAHVRG